jgi:tetratricopeptide (TPR) repeat protein
LRGGDLGRQIAGNERAAAAAPEQAAVNASTPATPPRRPSLDPASALARVDQALIADPRNATRHLQRAQCLLALRRIGEARAAAAAAEQYAPPDAAFWDALGGLHSVAADQARALAAYDRAVQLAPDAPRFRFNRATVRRFLGDLEGAESDYDRVLALAPDDFEAYKNRADLRTQTPARNHIAELEAALPRAAQNWQGRVQLRHALAKEYEDLGEYERSFAHLQVGARTRREHLRYDVAEDVATVQWIIDAFPSGPDAAATDSGTPTADESPIFILGLPRSGTTLVERILASHSHVVSAGELNDFAMSLVAAARPAPGAAPLPRRELVARSATLDFAALGREYLQRARAQLGDDRRFIDKMPLNYLYCGLIRRALPAAKIVHLHRHPLAAGYAMYKTLFRDGYPFSYDLGEIARYYAAYRRLMAHWQATMPGAIHSLSYEALVADPAATTRGLMEFCGLDWEDAVSRFHLNPTPSTTASAAQVRRPIYDSAVSKWRHYERQLAPLREALIAAGVTGIDAPPGAEQGGS